MKFLIAAFLFLSSLSVTAAEFDESFTGSWDIVDGVYTPARGDVPATDVDFTGFNLEFLPDGRFTAIWYTYDFTQEQLTPRFLVADPGDASWVSQTGVKTSFVQPVGAYSDRSLDSVAYGAFEVIDENTLAFTFQYGMNVSGCDFGPHASQCSGVLILSRLTQPVSSVRSD